MKQGSNNRRSRSRGGGGGKRHSGGGGRNSFESNGPDVKIRGTAQQVQEKYISLARDATSSGDWVSAEAYFQFAEHYYRVDNSDGQKQGQAQNKGQGGRNDQKQNIAAAEKPAPQADPKPELKAGSKPVSKGDAADASPATLAAAVAEREAAETPKDSKTKPDPVPEKAAS